MFLKMVANALFSLVSGHSLIWKYPLSKLRLVKYFESFSLPKMLSIFGMSDRVTAPPVLFPNIMGSSALSFLQSIQSLFVSGGETQGVLSLELP